MSAWNALKADTHRCFGRYSWRLLVSGYLKRRTFRPVITMRLCQMAAGSRGLGRLALPFCNILHRQATHSAAMDLPWQTQVGPGLALIHGWSLVVNREARIGGNVTLFHGVTLGRRDRIGRDGQRLIEFPTLEDEVWVGPLAIIVGGITIGRGSRIGGGAFVTEDVPPYSIVSGNPATIVKSGCTPDVMNPAPLLISNPEKAAFP